MFETLWQLVSSSFYRVVLPLLTVIALTLLALKLINSAAAAIEKRIIEPTQDRDRRERLKTLVKAGRYTLRGLVLFVAVLIGLGTIGIDIGPALAAVGVLGLAVSLGAQTLIKDVIGGLTILLEDEYRIGDSVKIGSVSGDVERITLRRTDVRDKEGRLHIVPNGDVRAVANESKEWSRALVELNFDFDADIDGTARVLHQAMEKMAADPEVKPHLLAPPEVFGWNELNEWSVIIRLRAKVKADQQKGVSRVMRRHALDALNQAGIRVTTPP